MRGTLRLASSRRSSMFVMTGAFGAAMASILRQRLLPLPRRERERRRIEEWQIIAPRGWSSRPFALAARRHCGDAGDETAEPFQRRGAHAEQAQAPRQVDALQALAGGAADLASVERVRGQRQVAGRCSEVV